MAAEAVLSASQSPPAARKRTRLPASNEEAPSNTVVAEGSDPASRRTRPQRGVVGVEPVTVLSDRQRRDLERRLDLITEEVDSQDQFKRFNVGWVLPEGSKRRRSERPHELEPSRSAKCMIPP